MSGFRVETPGTGRGRFLARFSAMRARPRFKIDAAEEEMKERERKKRVKTTMKSNRKEGEREREDVEE